MNSQSFNSKKYALAFFTSTCLLASSFLSTSARAASFTQLVNKTPALRNLSGEAKQKNEWRNYSVINKLATWKAAKLVPDLNQAILDVQNGFDPKLLSDSNINIRHKAREKNAEVMLYIAQIKQPDYNEKFNEYINRGVIPMPEEVGQNLGIDYDARKTNNKKEKDQKVRRAEKDKKAIIDRYIDLIKIALVEKEYITTGRVPELEELTKKLDIDKAKAKIRRAVIRDQVMENKKAELITIGKIPTQEELNKLFGKDRESSNTKYINDIRTCIMRNNRQNYVDTNHIPKTQEIMKEFNIDKGSASLYLKQIKAEIAAKHQANNNQNTARTFSQISFDTGRKKKQPYSFDPRSTFQSLFKFKAKKDNDYTQSQKNIYKIIQQEENIEVFKNLIKIDPIAALNLEVDSSYKKEAVNIILSDFNNDTIQKILFIDDKGQLNFNTTIDVKNKPILNELLKNSSEEQRNKIIENISKYAKENIIPLVFKREVRHDKLSGLLKLAAIKDKLIVQELLTLQLELKNDLHSYNAQGNGIPPEAIKAINEVLREYNATARDLSSAEIIKLANSFNIQGFQNSIKIMTSSEQELTKEIDNLFGLSIQNETPNNGNIPTPPPLPLLFSNLYLDKLKDTPKLYALYDQFIQNNKSKNKITPGNINESETPERIEPKTEYAKLYKQYRAETCKKADNLQDQLLKKQSDIINVIRQILTASYADQGIDTEDLITLFGNPNPEVTEKAQEVFVSLVQDPYVQDIIVNGKKAMTSEAILKNLFNEDADDAVERILLSSCKISEELKKPIEYESNKSRLIKELENKQNPFEQLKFAYEKAAILGQKFDTKLAELIKNPAILTTNEQVTFLTKENNELKKVINSDQAQAKLDDLRTAILSTIKFEELTTVSLPQNDFIAIVKEKDPELLKEFLKATIIKQESNNNLDQLRLALPSFTGMSDQQVRILASKLNMSVILKALEECVKEKAKNHTHTRTRNMPLLPPSSPPSSSPPPPPPPSSLEISQLLTSLGFTEDWINRITKLNEKTNTLTSQIVSKNYNFKSDIALRYKDFALSGEISAGYKAKYSDDDLLRKAMIESIALEHSKNVSEVNQNKKYFEKIQEAVSTMQSSFIGPRTEMGQEIHNIYTSKLLKLIKDKEFIRYVEDNIKSDKKRKDEVIEAFDTVNSDFIGPRTAIGQDIRDIYTQQMTKYTEETVREAFDTVNSDFIGPRTEIGQELYDIYRKKLLESEKNKTLLLFTKQLITEFTELEQKYGSDIQPENKDNKESLVEKMKKRFQQENEVKNDESSTESDTQHEDNNKKLEVSDSKTVLSPRLSNSNDSKNDKSSDDKKSLLALRSSDEEDKGYETDEKELEESNNTTEEEFKKDIPLESEDEAISMSLETEEEFKKDIPLESEDEAINMSLETEEIARQDEAVLKEQISKETNNKVAILVKAASTLHKHVHPSILTKRLNIGAAIAAGDEEASINRGLWISGLYGINKQRAWKNIPKYQGRTTGATIGADAEFINSHDIIGIAYSRLDSQVKYNKKLGKTAVNGHLLSIYGLKELIKGFSLQAIISYGHNYIKNKSISTNNIVGKYQNNNVNFESSLNYKYRTKYDLYLIPNISFKYDYSRASNYKEYNVDIENLMIQKKSNQSFESSLGGKIVFKPIATISNIVLTPSLYGNIEHHFNNKNTKVNAKATFKGQTLQETIILPKQPKLGYNIGSNILMSRKNINVLLEYNYYTHRKYQSHQGLVKLKVNL
ncbi:MAG: autotransporter outer membrane beta-barrel domain-containing protein [Rickettsia endosymbiont of Ixodes persulcatus]|nr:autotransporter outer membrane beta-barrel domain-containing protein [Rickettsia endosymbiont of Ixodes persulcatus]MCZ6909148.1 autotransporter outer membrane beta-barrel domain-containing protein [Rickettsia endosymbiont of Ixodes persulcatus]